MAIIINKLIESENRETVVRVTLRSLFFYVIFLIISTTVIMSMIPPMVHTYTTQMKRQFLDDTFDSNKNDPIVFNDIRTVIDFWNYLTFVAVPNLFFSKWAGNTNFSGIHSLENYTVLYENIILGRPRLRQLRVRDDSCIIHENLKNHFKKCFGKYSKSNEDRSTNFAYTGNKYEYSFSSSYLYYFGFVSIYGSGGFISFIGNNRQHALDRLYKLRDDMWILQETRVVFLDFTLYNANLDLFCIVKLIFEFPPSGGIIPSSSFLTVNLRRYKEPRDFIVLGLEFVYMCYIFYFIYQEIQNCKKYRYKYFRIFWTYVNILIIFGSFLLIPFNTYKFLFVTDKVEEAAAHLDRYADMELIALFQWIVNNIEAILLFLIWIKIFQFLNMSKTMGQLGATLHRCGEELLVFAAMFFLIFNGFALVGYLLFGEQNNHFSTYFKSLMTMLITILGDFDYYAIEKDNKILAPIFFTTYIFFVFFVLFNMFLAIITGTFSKVKDDIQIKKAKLDINDYLLRFPKNIFSKCCPHANKYKKHDMKLSSNETISEIRRILELCNFSDSEIIEFFGMYNIDEDSSYKDSRVLQLLNDIREHRPRPEPKEEKPKIELSTLESFQERFDTLNVHFSKILKETMEHLTTKVEEFNK